MASLFRFLKPDDKSQHMYSNLIVTISKDHAIGLQMDVVSIVSTIKIHSPYFLIRPSIYNSTNWRNKKCDLIQTDLVLTCHMLIKYALKIIYNLFRL